jgi:HEAT repeat protein
MSPDEGRKIILAEIAKPEGSDVPFSTLAMLPDPSLPEMDEVLAAKFDPLLIVRYATGSVIERIKSRVEETNGDLRRQNLPSCVGPIAFYFLKHDPHYGERLLREQFEAETAAPFCYDIGAQFSQLGRWAYSPALERLAIQSLTSPKVPVKRGAAEVLGRFGSEAAQKPLWEAMEYFRHGGRVASPN